MQEDYKCKDCGADLAKAKFLIPDARGWLCVDCYNKKHFPGMFPDGVKIVGVDFCDKPGNTREPL